MANIKDKIDNIRKAIFGKDVRGSLADGLDAVNKETETTTKRQEHLEETFDQLIINSGASNAEIVDARVDKNNGTSYKKIGDRLDAHSSHLDGMTNIFGGMNLTSPNGDKWVLCVDNFGKIGVVKGGKI